MLGVADVHAAHSSVLLAGVAGLAAGSMSMAAGDYVSVHSQADTRFSTFKKEECGSPPERNIKQQQLSRSWAQMIFLASSASQGTPFACPRLSR
jgi:hypothetical protein